MRNLIETTFRPLPDSAAAQEGFGVVLKATPAHAMILEFFHGAWRVMRMASAGVDKADMADALRWRGRWYVRRGETLTVIDPDASPEAWDRLYRELLCVGHSGFAEKANSVLASA